ncbi:MAG: cell division protein FtsZ [Rhodospirillales bacterium]|nr:cell division protein FtsZ [Rhodospirillales bacterium]
MSINLSMPEPTLLHPKILVIGVGGAGGNAVNNMIAAKLQGVEFVVANTDAQALDQSSADRKIQLGTTITQGLGAGSRPDVGRAAAEESMEQLIEYFSGTHMIFVTAGMGGGTGTGAAPVIAQLARERDILTVGVVTKPFQFEGDRRMAIAEQGIQELQQYVDTLIVIPNQNLFRVANEKTTFSDAFSMADEVLHSGVRGVTDLMVMPGLINLDFADVRTVMAEMGKAVMGTGEAEGESRATEAAQAAISNPLLDDLSITGAEGVLINITGGMDMTLFEVDEAADFVRKEVDPNANIIVGSTFDEGLTGRMRVSVVATGLDSDAIGLQRPVSRVTTLHSPMRTTASVAAPTAPIPTAAKAPSAPVVSVEPAPVAAPEIPESSYEDEPFDLAKALSAAGEGLDGFSEKGEVAESVPFSVVGDEPVAPMPIPEPRSPSEANPAEAHILREVRKAQEASPVARSNETVEEQKPGIRASLFARVAGVGWVRAKEDAPEPHNQRTAKEPARVGPAFEGIRETTTVGIEASGRSAAETASVDFGDVKPVERTVPSVPDDDQLEIPAFLRRQAN